MTEYTHGLGKTEPPQGERARELNPKVYERSKIYSRHLLAAKRKDPNDLSSLEETLNQSTR